MEPAPVSTELKVTFDLAAGCFRFDWARGTPPEVIARGTLAPTRLVTWRIFSLEWDLEVVGQANREHYNVNRHSSSVAAFMRRVQKRFPVADAAVEVWVIPPGDWGTLKANTAYGLRLPERPGPWKWLAGEIRGLSQAVEFVRESCGKDADLLRQRASLAFAQAHLPGGPPGPLPSLLKLRVTFDQIQHLARFDWTQGTTGAPVASGCVRCTGRNELTWELESGGQREQEQTSHHRNGIRAALDRWRRRFPITSSTCSAGWIKPQPNSRRPLHLEEPPFDSGEELWAWVEDNLAGMAEASRFQFSPLGRMLEEMDPIVREEMLRYEQRLLRKEARRAEEEERRRANMERLAAERRLREQRQAEAGRPRCSDQTPRGS